METYEAYFSRKLEELRLVNSCLKRPLPETRPQSINDVINRKFELVAALRAEHDLADWAITETAWSHGVRRRSGPFKFSYDYQRADLEVCGPSFYQLQEIGCGRTIYAASGMAAISAVLLALVHITSEAELVALPGSYGETLELVEGFARHLRLRSVPLQEGPSSSLPRIFLLDSCVTTRSFEAALRCKPCLDLLIFDTTCFSVGSGRIRRVVQWARACNIPVILVRSHTKLDSLGAEYGRLGSALFLHGGETDEGVVCARFGRLQAHTFDAVRLLGNAAVPAHFPPFIGLPAYRSLTRRRHAAILRNSRRAAASLRSLLAGRLAQLAFVHGLYLTLGGKRTADETEVAQIAAEMSNDLGRAGYPIRHAGSFGFDFAATEWFRDSATGRYSVRVAVPDLPTDLWSELTSAIGRWWLGHQGS